MARKIIIGISVTLLLAAIGLVQALYMVDETNYAVVQQFGDIKSVGTNPGPALKIPFIQQVTYLDRRILTSDTSAEEYLTSDEKRIVVDQVTRWRIVDPRSFFLKHTTEDQGRSRLERLVLGALREQIAARLYDTMISSERDNIMISVRNAVEAQVIESGWGIHLVDVRTKRADLPTAVEQSVYERMASDRQVEAKRHRAEGQRKSDQITSETDRNVTIMDACASRISKEIRGEGEALAIAIFAEALQQDPDFFAFIRRLEAYETSFKSEDRLILSTDTNFFRLLAGDTSALPSVVATKGDVQPLSPDVTKEMTTSAIEGYIKQCIPETVTPVGE